MTIIYSGTKVASWYQSPNPKDGLGLRLPNRTRIRQLKALRRSLHGALLCGTLAIVAAYLFREYSFSLDLPLCFIAVLLVTTVLWGRVAGIVGSIVSAITFTLLLFAPFGSFAVSDAVAKLNLACMLMGGLLLSCFVQPLAQKITR